MSVKHFSRIAGALHYLDRLAVLPDDDCNVLLVSSRTLYLLANYATQDVNFTGRYVSAELPGGYVRVGASSLAEADLIDQIANRFRLEVIPVTCDLVALLEQINTTLQTIAAKPVCCNDATGTELPEAPEPSIPPVGPDTDFEDGEAYNLYKCLAAQSVLYGFISSQTLIITQYPFGWVNIAVAAMNAVVIYALQATKLGALAITLGAVADIVAIIIDLTVEDVTRVRDELQVLEDELRCAMYCAGNTTQAIDDFRTVLEGSTVLTAGDLEYLELYMLPVVFNRLFEYRPDQVEFAFSGDCSDCGCADLACTFQFATAGDPLIELGSGEFDHTGLQFVLSSVEISAGVHVINFAIPDLCTICSPAINWCVVFDATTITTGLTASWTRELYSANCPGPGLTEEDFTDEFPDLDVSYGIASAAFSNPDPFTITMRIIGQTAGTTSIPSLAGC